MAEATVQHSKHEPGDVVREDLAIQYEDAHRAATRQSMPEERRPGRARSRAWTKPGPCLSMDHEAVRSVLQGEPVSMKRGRSEPVEREGQEAEVAYTWALSHGNWGWGASQEVEQASRAE